MENEREESRTPEPGADSVDGSPETGEDPAFSALLRRFEPGHPDLPVPRAEALLSGWRVREAEELRARPRVESASPVPRRYGWGSGRRGLVAGLVLALVGWTAAQVLLRTTPTVASGEVELVTGPGETTTARLSDGSLVRLASNSTLRFTENGVGREVVLEGRAFFAVASDPTRPFRVTGSGGEAVALGTRFELQTEEQGLRLLVIDGRVALSSGRETAEVGAGEARAVRDGALTEPETLVDPYPHLEWMGRTLVFQNTAMAAVARELESRYATRVFLNPQFRGHTVTGWFTDMSFDDVLAAICRATDVRCSRTEEGAMIGY